MFHLPALENSEKDESEEDHDVEDTSGVQHDFVCFHRGVVEEAVVKGEQRHASEECREAEEELCCQSYLAKFWDFVHWYIPYVSIPKRRVRPWS